jgi:hypothetical protein
MSYWKVKRRRSQSEYKGIQVNLCNAYPVKIGGQTKNSAGTTLRGRLCMMKRRSSKRQSGSTKFYDMQNGQRLVKGESCFDFKPLLSHQPTACAGCYRGRYNTDLVKDNWGFNIALPLPPRRGVWAGGPSSLRDWRAIRVCAGGLPHTFHIRVAYLYAFVSWNEWSGKIVGKKFVSTVPHFIDDAVGLFTLGI